MARTCVNLHPNFSYVNTTLFSEKSNLTGISLCVVLSAAWQSRAIERAPELARASILFWAGRVNGTVVGWKGMPYILLETTGNTRSIPNRTIEPVGPPGPVFNGWAVGPPAHLPGVYPEPFDSCRNKGERSCAPNQQTQHYITTYQNKIRLRHFSTGVSLAS